MAGETYLCRRTNEDMSTKSSQTRGPIRWLITAAAGLLLLAVAFLGAGRLLVYDEPPRHADVIVVLAGDRGARTAQGAALYHAGWAPQLIVSGGPTYHTTTIAALMRDHAVELGVPADAVIIEDQADSTYGNAVFTQQLMEEHGYTTALVLSSNYHMRRVKYTFEREFRESGIELTYCAATDPNFDPARWWTNNKSVMYTFTEYVKFIGYALGRNT